METYLHYSFKIAGMSKYGRSWYSYPHNESLDCRPQTNSDLIALGHHFLTKSNFSLTPQMHSQLHIQLNYRGGFR